MNPITIRQAVISNAPALQECMTAAYSIYAQRMKGISLPPLEVDYEAEILNFPTWVAEREGKIAGGLIMMFNSDYAFVSNIAVHPEAQGCGLGRRLLEFAEQQAMLRDYKRMQLATHARLTENEALYQHLGWKVIERNSDRIIMQKHLT